MVSASRRHALTAVLATTLGVLAVPPADAGAPTERLREFFGRVNVILADPATEDRPLERVARVRRLVGDIADMTAASAMALGPDWETATAAEREEFTALFSEVLERAYVGRLAGAARVTGGLVMGWGDEIVTGSEAVVKTALHGRGQDVRVDYVMTSRTGRWRVRDIVLDGVSTVENYRAQFKRLRQHGSYIALVRQMRDKLTEASLMFARVEPGALAGAATTEAVTPPPPAPARAPAPAKERPRAPRVEPIRPPAPAIIAAMHPMAGPPRAAAMTAPPSATTTAPPAVSPAPPLPTVAARRAPGVIEAGLGALLLGAVGAGSATYLRRRARRRHRPAPSDLVLH